MGILIYAFAWFVFAIFHSLLARPFVQAKLESFLYSCYRLTYNVVALLKISVVLYVGKVWVSDARFSAFDSNILLTAASSVRLLGLLVLLLALRAYDLGRFSGITQIITGELVSSLSNEPLQRRFLNRWVRHPLYTGAFLILWGGAVSPLGFWTAVWGTIYIVIGTVYEERTLTTIYGDDYRNYQQEVPKYFPALNRKVAN